MTGTRRVALRVDGASHDWWTAIEIVRDLSDISGGFQIDLHDVARARRAFPGPTPAAPPTAIEAGMPCELAIDGEVVLVGHVDDLKISWSDTDLRIGVAGRDRTGDLVDCAAAVDGPVEWRGLTLEEIARRICAPFGIDVRAETDVGPPFALFGIEVAERAMEAIERGCRQRGILAVSDGVGGLVLTRGGTRRAPGKLSIPGNVQQAAINRSWKDRFSEYLVKGQTRPPRAGPAALDGAAAPLAPDAPAAARPRQAEERAAILMTGRARDAEVTRHRPTVRLAKTQSGGATVQTQAEWQMRVARGQAETLTYSVRDWRAGPERRLWRPNELATVDDPMAGILGDMLITAVTYRYSEQDGTLAELRLTGPEAFDLLPEAEDERPATRRRRDAARPLDGTARPLSPDSPR